MKTLFLSCVSMRQRSYRSPYLKDCLFDKVLINNYKLSKINTSTPQPLLVFKTTNPEITKQMNAKIKSKYKYFPPRDFINLLSTLFIHLFISYSFILCIDTCSYKYILVDTYFLDFFGQTFTVVLLSYCVVNVWCKISIPGLAGHLRTRSKQT